MESGRRLRRPDDFLSVSVSYFRQTGPGIHQNRLGAENKRELTGSRGLMARCRDRRKHALPQLVTYAAPVPQRRPPPLRFASSDGDRGRDSFKFAYSMTMINCLCLANDHNHDRFVAYVASVDKQSRLARGRGRACMKICVARVAREACGALT
jgi:hypothetical protein